MTTGQQEYQTQVYHVQSMTLQNEFQYPRSPVASSSRAVISPAGSPSTRRVNTATLNIASAISTSYDGDDEYIGSLKSETDVYRERGAKLQALALLNVEVGGVVPNDKPKVSAMTARRAAVLNYEQKQKEKIALKATVKALDEAYPKRAPVLVAPSRKKKLAETTRKVKPLEEDEFADFKCQMDLDREQQAKNKALRLLNHGFMY
jgi:hypothetical protein